MLLLRLRRKSAVLDTSKHDWHRTISPAEALAHGSITFRVDNQAGIKRLPRKRERAGCWASAPWSRSG